MCLTCGHGALAETADHELGQRHLARQLPDLLHQCQPAGASFGQPRWNLPDQQADLIICYTTTHQRHHPPAAARQQSSAAARGGVTVIRERPCKGQPTHSMTSIVHHAGPMGPMGAWGRMNITFNSWSEGWPAISHRRDCHFEDTPCLSLLKHLIKVQGVPSNDSFVSYLRSSRPLEPGLQQLRRSCRRMTMSSCR